jgi:hypothetical protein
MRRALKIILIVIAILVIVLVSVLALSFLDVAAYTATGSQTLTPSGFPIGNALVVYDPGITGQAKGFADKVASDLQSKEYTVTLAGIKSSAASKTLNYSIIVIGGPIYGGKPSVTVTSALNKLSVPSRTKIGMFGSGWFPMASDVKTMRNSVTVPSNTVIVKVNGNGDLATQASDFVNQLLS